MDRFLCLDIAPHTAKKNLQLVAITCLMIASKFSGLNVVTSDLDLERACFVTGNYYSKKQVFCMEVQILNRLDHRLEVPSTLQFLVFFYECMGLGQKPQGIRVSFLARYLAESTLLDTKFLNYKPSEIAAGALYLANWIVMSKESLSPSPGTSTLWSDRVAELAGLDAVNFVRPLAEEIFEQVSEFRNPNKALKTLFLQYSEKIYGEVAQMVPSVLK